MKVAGNYLFVASRGDGTVSVIDTTTNTLVDTNPTLAGTQPIKVGNDPRGLAVSSDGSRIYVSNYASNTVSVIDTATNKVVSPITVGHGPVGMAVNGNRLYVANRVDDTVKVIDTTTNKVVGAAIGVDRGPTGVIFSPDGSLVYVTNSARAP